MKERDMAGHTGFYCEMLERQLAWRKKQKALNQDPGLWVGRPYAHVFPSQLKHQNLWPGMWHDGEFPLEPYLAEGKIQAHKGMGNLLSSWALCANLYFPFGRSANGRGLLAGFLSAQVGSHISSIRKVELEWEHETDARFRPPELLGEKDGSRGSNQTSPDVAFDGVTEDGRSVLVLTEVKFTERHFYPCSVFKKPEFRTAGRSAGCGACRTAPVHVDPDVVCAQTTVLGRRYWEHLKDVFNWQVELSRCPAARDGYQLFRQQSLAEALARSGAYDTVVSTVAFHEGNDDLLGCLGSTGIADIRCDWAPLFRGKVTFATFTHQQWVQYVREQPELLDWCENWLGYVNDRYGM